MQNKTNIPCPCGTGLFYPECCEPAIRGYKPASTAEKLMRSRYSAYVNCEIDYLVETTYPNQRKFLNPESMRNWSKNSEWHKLEIIKTKAGMPEDNTGEVEFIAYFSEKGVQKKHPELSYFIKEDEKWYFDNSDKSLKVTVKPKIGRNEPCPCGSGNKFKKCCGK